MKSLIILPTFDEKDNLPVILIKALAFENFDILIVDDNSSDGTRDIARHWVEKDSRVNLIERSAKLGLGTAYVSGFKWGLKQNYDCFIEMDSDLSHNPLDLPRFVEEIEKGSDLVIGSRYIGGKISVVGWDFKRLLLSRFGNYYALRILQAPLTDMTSGFRAFTRRALESIDLDSVTSEGYAFQIEMAYRVWHLKLGVKEIPIIFTERTAGFSKMSRKIVREAVWLPWRLKLRELMNFIKKSLGMVSYQNAKKQEASDRKKQG